MEDADDVVDIDFRNPYMDENYETKLPTCGYFMVSCPGMPRPKAWAFWLPNTDIHRARLEELGYGHWGPDPWPLCEFRYPEEKPNWGVLVDYPKGVVEKHTHWRWNSEKKRNEWQDSDGSWNEKRTRESP